MDSTAYDRLARGSGDYLQRLNMDSSLYQEDHVISVALVTEKSLHGAMTLLSSVSLSEKKPYLVTIKSSEISLGDQSHRKFLFV